MGKRTTPKKAKGEMGNTKMAAQLAAQASQPTPQPAATAQAAVEPDVFTAEDLQKLTDSFSTPQILRSLERTGANTYRFMPGRQAKGDDRILFPSMRYAEWIAPDMKKLESGVGVGPEQKKPIGIAGEGFALSKGGVIVPARTNAKYETVPVREFRFKDDRGKPQKRSFIDWASFEKDAAGKAFVTHYGDQREVYVEVWTGDFGQRVRRETLQHIQGGVFAHGSCALTGGDLIVNAQSLNEGRPDSQFIGGPDVDALSSQAELLGELRGDWLSGYLLWLNRLWKIRYTPKHSEEVLVRQLGRYFVLYVRDGVLDYYEGTEKQYGEAFQRLTVQQALVPLAHSKSKRAPKAKAA